MLQLIEGVNRLHGTQIRAASGSSLLGIPAQPPRVAEPFVVVISWTHDIVKMAKAFAQRMLATSLLRPLLSLQLLDQSMPGAKAPAWHDALERKMRARSASASR